MESRLLNYLHTSGANLEGHLGPNMMPKYPFYSSVSRCRHKPDPFHNLLTSETVDELIALGNHGMTFEQVTDKRAVELSALPEEIFVMWSGGIDSTIVVAGLLRNWSRNDLDRVTVLCNTDSIRECPEFFRVIAKNLRTEVVHARLEEFLERGYVLTGEHGDQIFGSDMPLELMKRLGEHTLWEPWQAVGSEFFSRMSPTHGLATFNNYAQLVPESPIDIVTIRDFFWWVNFTQKWQHVRYRVLMSDTWNDPKKYFPKIVHFFDSPEYQVWSIHNHDKKIKDNWLSYKYLGKEYVVDYTKDPSFHNKMKVISLQNLYVGTKFNFAIDENWQFLTLEQCIQRIRK